MSSDYKYDVFISYSTEDREWAKRLFDDLQKKQNKVFLDQHRLVAGGAWRPELQEAVTKSRHLVVLWSEHAMKSQWVIQESTWFRLDPLHMHANDRLLIPIILEGSAAIFGDVHQVTELARAGAYQAGFQQLNRELWNGVVAKVADAVQSRDPALRVPLLLLAITRERLDKLQPVHPSGLRLDELLDRFGIGSKDELAAIYGERPKDWRPFGSRDTIETILDTTKDQINSLVTQGGTLFRWDYLAKDFWSLDRDAFLQEVRRLNSGPAVLVVDPISLYDPTIEYRYTQLLNKFFDNQDGFTVVLAPFSMPQSSQYLRKLVERMASRIFERFYEPPVLTHERYARCAANIGDGMDLKAWLLTAVGPVIRTNRPSKAPYPLDPAIQ
jgi:hypothetical protein